MSPRALPAVAVAAGVGADELHRLHEHAGGAAAGVVNPALIGLQHLDQELHHAARGVELAALLALGAGELGEEVLIDSAQNVLGAGLLVPDLDVADQVDDLAQPLLVQRRPGVVLGQYVLEHRVVPLDADHSVVDGLADGGLAGLGLELRPASLGRRPEDVLGPVLVRVLGVSALVACGVQLGVNLFEGVGDVLEEDQAQDDVLVLGGVHAAAQGVRHPPQLGLVAGGGAVATVVRSAFGLPLSRGGHFASLSNGFCNSTSSLLK